MHTRFTLYRRVVRHALGYYWNRLIANRGESFVHSAMLDSALMDLARRDHQLGLSPRHPGLRLLGLQDGYFEWLHYFSCESPEFASHIVA